MKIQQPTSPSPLDQMNKTQPLKPSEKSSQSDFSSLLNSELTLQNGGGGHPDKKKTEN